MQPAWSRQVQSVSSFIYLFCWEVCFNWCEICPLFSHLHHYNLRSWSLFRGLSLKPPCCLCFGFNLGSLAVVSSASGLLNRTASVLEQIWSLSLFVWWLWVCIRLLIRVRLGCKSNVFVLNKKAVEYICMWRIKEKTRRLSKISACWSLKSSPQLVMNVCLTQTPFTSHGLWLISPPIPYCIRPDADSKKNTLFHQQVPPLIASQTLWSKLKRK